MGGVGPAARDEFAPDSPLQRRVNELSVPLEIAAEPRVPGGRRGSPADHRRHRRGLRRRVAARGVKQGVWRASPSDCPPVTGTRAPPLLRGNYPVGHISLSIPEEPPMSVRVERSDRIVTVILSRPEARNAASPTRSRTDQRRCANYIVKSSRCERPREPATGFAVGTSRPFRMRLCQGIRIGRFLAHFTQLTVT